MNIASNGILLYVDEQGDGDMSLVFLHYWGGSSRTWRHVIAALPKSYRTIAIDHRGWGESDAPATGYALSDLADDAQGVVDALNLKRYMLIGHSMGGKVAQLMASRRPDGLIGLVLVAPSPPQPLALPAEAREAMAAAYSTRDSVGTAIDQMLTAKVLSTEDREQVIEDSLRGAPQAKAAWPRSTSFEDITRDVAAINAPTIVVAGSARCPACVARDRASVAVGVAAGTCPGDRRLRRCTSESSLAQTAQRSASPQSKD